MAIVKIPGLRVKTNADGSVRHYWEPSATLRRQGWAALTLDADPTRAWAQAEARNREVEEWRAGQRCQPAAGGTDRRRTWPALVAAYQASDRWRDLRPRTQAEYAKHLTVLERWAADTPVAAITRGNVQKLYAALRAPRQPDENERLAWAHAVVRTLRLVLQYAVDHDDWPLALNPATKPDIKTPPPRQQVWPDHVFAPFEAAAVRLGRRSIADAVLCAALLGQRQADILALRWSAYRDGRLHVQQAKTGQWVAVRPIRELARRIAELQDTNRQRAAPHLHILIDEGNEQPWNASSFGHWFARVRAEAIAPGSQLPTTLRAMADGVAPCPDLKGLEFRDLRRTAVVWLGEAGCELHQIAAISGHRIESCKDILEVYLPRSVAMADAAIEQLEAHRARKAEQAVNQTSILSGNGSWS